MDKKTTGAWLIHHTGKLQQVTASTQFERITLAGKAGMLLSALSETNQNSQLSKEKVETLAKASNINTYVELPTLINKLVEHRLLEISQATGTIEVLGLTTSSILQHTADIFTNTDPQNIDLAVLELSEFASKSPTTDMLAKEYLCDTYQLPTQTIEEVLAQSEEIGFIDYEPIEDQGKLYFNGNLFRTENSRKVYAIVSSLSSMEGRLINEVNSLFDRSVAVPASDTINILGTDLFKKLASIGMYDLNTISNERDNMTFITKPSVFSKYGNTFVDDALDLVKAFVTSLTYGMTYSSYSRGRISMLPALMSKLIRGDWIGPATAIGHDYRALELKHVIQVQDLSSGMFKMKLLKKDVGELALQALVQGDISETSLPQITGASITNYVGPENNRELVRKKQSVHNRQDVVNIIRTLRS